jgi:hypothetical protein
LSDEELDKALLFITIQDGKWVALDRQVYASAGFGTGNIIIGTESSVRKTSDEA